MMGGWCLTVIMFLRINIRFICLVLCSTIYRFDDAILDNIRVSEFKRLNQIGFTKHINLNYTKLTHQLQFKLKLKLLRLF